MADLTQLPNRDRVADDADGVMSRPWLKWFTDLRDGVNKLIVGEFDDDVTVAGDLTVEGDVSVEGSATFDNTITIENPGNAGVFLRDTGAAADEKTYLNYTDDGLWLLATTTDANAFGAAAIIVDRSGATVTSVALNAPIFERGRTTALGEWTSVAFNAANFTSTGGGTAWTVIGANQTNYAYTMIGKTMHLTFAIINTNVTGAPGTLELAIPGGFLAATGTPLSCIRVIDAGGAVATGLAVAGISAAGTVSLFSNVGGGGWTATAGNNTQVWGQITFPVQ